MTLENINDKLLIKELSSRIERYKDEIEGLENELIELRDKYADSESMKTKFLSIIRNELKNPAAAISALAKMIASSDELKNDHVVKIFRAIKFESTKFSLQLDNILKASSLESGDSRKFISCCDMNELFSEVLSMYREKINEKHIEFNENLDDDIRCDGDREEIKLVLRNLFDNAIKFCNSEIKVSCGIENDKVKLSFFNDGLEIDKDLKSFLFERFRPGDLSLSRKYQGVGLGLSVSKTIVEIHDGDMSFESGNGNGTVFEVELPVKREDLDGSDETSCDIGFIQF